MTVRRGGGGLLAAALLLAAAVGCGDQGAAGLTPVQQAALHATLAKARAAADAHDAAGSGAALEDLHRQVVALREHGDLGGARAAQLLKYLAITGVKVQHTLLPATAPSTTAPAAAANTSTAAAPTSVSPPAQPATPSRGKTPKHGKPKNAKRHGKDD